MQAGACVPTAGHVVDVTPWLEGVAGEAAAAAVTQTSQSRAFEGFHFCLDALTDASERRQAKEYIRTLGGQVRSLVILDFGHPGSYVDSSRFRLII